MRIGIARALGLLVFLGVAGRVLAQPADNMPNPPAAGTPALVSCEPEAVSAPCMECWQPCYARHTLIGGFGLWWVDPRIEADEAFAVFVTQTPAPGTTTNVTSREAFSYDGEFVPNVWLGVVGPQGYGVRGRAWWFETSASASTALGNAPPFTSVFSGSISINSPTTAGALATISVANAVELSVCDLEAIGGLTYGPLQIIYFGGARYLNSREQLTGAAFTPDGPLTSVQAKSSDFEGVGPLIGFEARYPILGGVTLYNSVRLALVFGHAAEFSATLTQGTIGSFGASSAEDLDVRRTGEIEIGGEWRADLAGNGLFLRAAWVGITTENVALTGLSLAAGLQR